MLYFENVSKQYKNGVNALYNINLGIEQGEFVYIIGPTGSGKSTMIRLLNGEEIPTKGTVKVGKFNVGKLKHSKVPLYRRHIGVVFQDFKLLERKTVFENIAFALEVVNTPRVELRKRVREVLRLVDLTEKANAYPNELSGGQQQRVAIGRAIANRPKVLICDEPTGNLDPQTASEIMELLEDINSAGTTILMATHAQEIVNDMKKRVIAIDKGEIVRDEERGRYTDED